VKLYTVNIANYVERVESSSRTLEVKCTRIVTSEKNRVFVERPWQELGAHDHYGELVRILYVKDPPVKVARWVGSKRDVLYYIDLCKVINWAPLEVSLMDLEVDFVISKSGIVKLLDTGELVASYRSGQISLEDLSQALFHLESLVNGFFDDLWTELERLITPFEELMGGFG